MAVMSAGVNARAIVGSRIRTEAKPARARYINPRAGRALELLGHAIEYLIDEYVQEIDRLSSTDAQVTAIQLLMALNREVYYECPLLPTAGERLRAFFGIPRR